MAAAAAVLILSRSTVDSAFGSAQDWTVEAGIWLIHWKRRALVTNVSKHMKNSLNADLLAFDYLEKDAASCSSATLASISGIGGALLKACFIFILSLWAFQASAQTTYPAANCSESAVSAAIAVEQAHPVDGDIITIPACPGGVGWPTGITHTFANSVTIQGAGATSSTAGGAGTTGTDQTVLIYSITTGARIMDITTTAGKSFRLTGVAIQGTTGGSPSSNGMISVEGTSTAVRVDHCHFHIPATVGGGIQFGGAVNGVADHNYFTTDANLGALNAVLFSNGVLWNGGTQADGSWADSPHWGTSQFIFMEDSRFYQTGLADVNDGARFVFRHNTVTGDALDVDSLQMYWHGITPDRVRGGKEGELYGNTFSSSSPIDTGAVVSPNSGTVLFWGNTITGSFKAAVDVAYDFRHTAGGGGNYNYTGNWKFCGTAANGGSTNPWDGNNNTASGWACLGQPGRGQGDLLTGSGFPGTVNSATGTVSWPHEVLTPIYSWMNSYSSAHYSGVYGIIHDDTAGSGGSLLTNNTDYFYECGAVDGVANPSCSSFNGAAGTGFGALANRPSTCKGGTDSMTGGGAPGVAYWATDTTTLYVCNPTNTWTVYYTPYTYPHPLTASSLGGSVAPPTGLLASVD
jgi:hypothetical protein